MSAEGSNGKLKSVSDAGSLFGFLLGVSGSGVGSVEGGFLRDSSLLESSW